MKMELNIFQKHFIFVLIKPHPTKRKVEIDK